jgi:hypothetical protein
MYPHDFSLQLIEALCIPKSCPLSTGLFEQNQAEPLVIRGLLSLCRVGHIAMSLQLPDIDRRMLKLLQDL